MCAAAALFTTSLIRRSLLWKDKPEKEPKVTHGSSSVQDKPEKDPKADRKPGGLEAEPHWTPYDEGDDGPLTKEQVDELIAYFNKE